MYPLFLATTASSLSAATLGIKCIPSHINYTGVSGISGPTFQTSAVGKCVRNDVLNMTSDTHLDVGKHVVIGLFFKPASDLIPL